MDNTELNFAIKIEIIIYFLLYYSKKEATIPFFTHFFWNFFLRFIAILFRE